MEKSTERGKLKVLTENEIIRRREKQFQYDQMWNGAARYFQYWDKTNLKFDSWTSPRYYEDNNKLMLEIRKKRDKEELLVRRRDKLRKMFDEERSTYEIELMMLRNKNFEKPQRPVDETPTNDLKVIHNELKKKEQERRKHEAEIKLYHQWRRNNPIVRQYESKYRVKDLKLSWLDQQIEKRMQKEREEEESKRLLKEREEKIKAELEKEEQFKRYAESKRNQLKRNLDMQIEELRIKQEISDYLKKQEDEELTKHCKLAEIEEVLRMEEKRRNEKECALFNLRQHKMKLKQKAINIQENLVQEKLLIERMSRSELENILEDEIKRKEIKEALSEFLDIVKQQQDLEKQRQRHLEFLFDSEVKTIYEKQTDIWRQEEAARQKLFEKVLQTVKMQVQENLNRNKERQRDILFEREQMTKQIEEYNKELHQLQDEEERKKLEFKKALDDDISIREMKKKDDDDRKLREIDEELDRIRKEEERLQQEILKLQKKHGPITSTKSSRIFF